MKQARWGLVLVLVVVTVAVAGCQWMPALVKRSEYGRLRKVDALNENLNARVKALIDEKDKIANEHESVLQLLAASDDAAAKATAESTRHKERFDALENELKAKAIMIAQLEATVADLREKAKGGDTAAGPGPVILPEGLEDVTVVHNALLGYGLSIRNEVLFDPGQATLKTGSLKIIKQLAQLPEIRDPGNFLRICGFSDSTPITHSQWKDNFQLSGERARAVLVALEEAGVSPSRMHFAGFGAHMLMMEDGKENKQKSRRVEIYIVRPAKTPTPAVTPK